MILEDKAVTLLAEWEQYKHAHYHGHISPFTNVIDIEMMKETVQTSANFVSDGLLGKNCSRAELLFRISSFENHLAKFKNHITLELLKHG